MNISTNLERSAFYFPDRIAVLDGSRSISYRQLNEEASRIASALIALGMQSRDFVGLCMPNSYEWLTYYFGIIKAGMAAVTLSYASTESEISQLLSDAQPRLLFTTDQKLNYLTDRKKYPYLEKIVCPGGDLKYEDLLEMGSPRFAAIDLDRNDTATILYTGGTTGSPKGVALTHENIKTSAHNVSYHERSNEGDRALCFLPLNHVFAQVHIMNSMIYAGGSIVIQTSYDLDKAIDAINRFRVTKFYAVPTIYNRLLQIDDLKTKLGSVTYCFSAAASIAAELVREWKSRVGLDVYEAFGMTETASMVTYNHYIQHVVGSIGTPVNTVEVQIRDARGNALGPGQEGEICICGPNVMKEYINKPEDTQASFWGRWLRSGDVGVFDEKGYLFILDRLKDLIITGGENVYPREIEEILYAIPEVAECSVIGMPDQEYGERVTACLVLKQKGQQLNTSDLKTLLKTKLSPWKVPKDYIVLDELPKSSTGKVLKRELKKNMIGKTKQ
jgi:long-chain acyl-CoA synthetase